MSQFFRFKHRCMLGLDKKNTLFWLEIASYFSRHRHRCRCPQVLVKHLLLSWQMVRIFPGLSWKTFRGFPFALENVYCLMSTNQQGRQNPMTSIQMYSATNATKPSHWQLEPVLIRKKQPYRWNIKAAYYNPYLCLWLGGGLKWS